MWIRSSVKHLYESQNDYVRRISVNQKQATENIKTETEEDKNDMQGEQKV